MIMTRFRYCLSLCALCLLSVHGKAETIAAAGTVGLPGNTVLDLRSPAESAGDSSPGASQQAVTQIRHEAKLQKTPADHRPLLDAVGDAQFVLLGEATHGSQEFYQTRSDITKKLILEKGFDAVAIEGDWPPALSVNQYIQDSRQHHASESGRVARSADEALAGFRRFPTWMWRNTEVFALVGWLREHNRAAAADAARPVGFYGLDLYSPQASMDAVVRYLEQTDARAARKARSRYACFDQYPDAEQEYGEAVVLRGEAGCERETRQQFEELSAETSSSSALPAASAEMLFEARQHARVAQNAEAYYRAMHAGANASWNVRDTHMADTLDDLVRHLSHRKGRAARVVIWAHNTHVGDARATEMGEKGEINLGQLVRQRYGRERSFLVGFTTHHGEVLAATEWGGQPEVKAVRPALPGSFSRMFHDTGLANFTLLMRDSTPAAMQLENRRLERAIGVIYRPETERASHYFEARLSRQFDAVIHVDRTRPVQPLDPLRKD